MPLIVTGKKYVPAAIPAANQFETSKRDELGKRTQCEKGISILIRL